jgi:maltose alpha-D-glucosyltransferase / alpha-amylase
MGVSGLRIDAAHIIVSDAKDQMFKLLENMRTLASKRNPDAILLGEANVEPDELQKFFSRDSIPNRLNMLFNFLGNKSLFLSFVRGSAKPLVKSLEAIRDVDGIWVNFIRHHDELNLEMLSEQEREEVFNEYAPDKTMRLFGHGIRRRLPPMFKGDRKQIELIYCIMFSMPGLPLINYGEEIAMGDDLTLKGRDSVRTVMQWDDSPNGGFSPAENKKLIHPVIEKGDYSYKKVNVRAQLRDPDSFLNWMERLISTRKHSPQLSYGKVVVLDNDQDSVLSFINVFQNNAVLLLHNLKNRNVTVTVDTDVHIFENITEILSNQNYDAIADLENPIELSAYGYRWLKCKYKKM